jgi:hypothetical protein
MSYMELDPLNEVRIAGIGSQLVASTTPVHRPRCMSDGGSVVGSLTVRIEILYTGELAPIQPAGLEGVGESVGRVAQGVHYGYQAWCSS